MAKRVSKNKKATIELLNIILDAANEKKAQNIIALNLTPFKQRICDYYVICNADTSVQIGAIVENIQTKTKKLINNIPFALEGKENAYWVIIDYIDVVVHVMQTQAREYYDLEKLWADAEVIKFNKV